MGKCLALQVCHTSKGKMIPEARDIDGKVVWKGDIEDLPDDEIKAFGKNHLKPVAVTEKRLRFHEEVLGKPGKTLMNKKAKPKGEA